MKQFMVAGALAASVLLVRPPKVSAQAPNGFVVDHFGAADQVYTIVNFCNLPGTPGCSEFDGAAFTCANIYAYVDQDIVACGSCAISPNGENIYVLRMKDLLPHPGLGSRAAANTPTGGVVKFVTTQFTANFCDPTALGITANSNAYFRSLDGLDIELAGVPLSAAEKDRLNRDCLAISTVLSGNFNATCEDTDPLPPGVKNNNKK